VFFESRARDHLLHDRLRIGDHEVTRFIDRQLIEHLGPEDDILAVDDLVNDAPPVGRGKEKDILAEPKRSKVIKEIGSLLAVIENHHRTERIQLIGRGEDHRRGRTGQTRKQDLAASGSINLFG